MNTNNNGNMNDNIRNKPLGQDTYNQGFRGGNQPYQNNYQQWYNQPPSEKQDVLGIIALILGIVSLTCCFISPFISIPTLIIATISIVKSNSQSKAKQIIAIALAVFSLCIWLFCVVFGVFDRAKEERTTQNNSNTNIESEQSTENNTLQTKDDNYQTEDKTQSNNNVKELVYDANDIKIYYTGLSTDIFGAELNFYIENNSAYNIMVGTDRTSVNGYEISKLIAFSVGAGLKANKDGLLSSSDLEQANISIDNIEEIVVNMHISDDDTWNRIDDFSFTMSME